MNEYIGNWLKVIEQMKNENTYKLAWGRAIIECLMFDKYKTVDHKVIIEFDDISEYMLRYYWNQQFFFKLKQSPNPKKMPKIYKLTGLMIEEYKTIKENAKPVWSDIGLQFIMDENPVLYSKTIKKISSILHENVCPRFKNIDNEVIELYEYSREKGSRIFIDVENVEPLKEYGVIISKLLNYKWAQLLEKFNYAPKIVNKVNGCSEAKLRRNSLTEYKKALLKQFEAGKVLDFYTDEELDISDISIDHVIPWSFMYSDDIWNLVVTSKSNNSSKSNRIPKEEDIEKLKKRNSKLVEILDGKFKEDLEVAIENGYVDKYFYESRL